MGLLIIGYTWGAKRSFDFSKEYLEKCGSKADRVYMIDGILKPIMVFPKAPIGMFAKIIIKLLATIKRD